MKYIVPAILLLFSRFSAGKPDVTANDILQDSINGKGGFGDRTEKYPWLAIIEQDGKDICLGVLTRENKVLTAAHCFHNESVKEESLKNIPLPMCKSVKGYRVRLPYSRYLNATAEVVDVAFDHTNRYRKSGSWSADISVARLSHPLTGWEKAPQIPTTTTGGESKDKGSCKMIYKIGEPRFVPKEKVVRIFPCNIATKRRSRIREQNDTFCVNSRATPGDSGGPTICHYKDKDYLVGITSQYWNATGNSNIATGRTVFVNLTPGSSFENWYRIDLPSQCWENDDRKAKIDRSQHE